MSDFLPPVVAVLASDITAYSAGMATAVEEMATVGTAFDGLIAQGDAASLAMARVAAASETAATENALAMDKMAADTAAMSARFELAEAKATASTEAFGVAMQGTAEKATLSSAETSSAMAGAGLAVGALAAGVVAVSVDLASKFETQMTRLYTAAGAPKAAVLASYDAVLKIANDVGQTGTAMAEALYHPISAGLDMATALQVVKYSAEEARISGANLDDTTYSLSSVMKAFNQSAADAGPTMALLNAVVGQGDMTFQDFNQSVKNWAPTAAQMGISIQSMGAGLAYLTDRGNSAEVAATRMTMGITMMTTPTKQAASLLEGLGVASGDVTASSALMQTALKKAGVTQNQLATDLKQPDGLYVALSDLKDHLVAAGVSGTEADSTLSKIFGGGRSDKAIMSLMQNLDGLKTKYQDIGAASSQAAFAASWQAASTTFSATMKQLLASLENLGIAIGVKVLPALTAMAKWFTDSVVWLTNHKTAMGIVVAVIGTALVVALSLAAAAAWTFAAAMWATGIPEVVLLVVAAIVLLGVAVYEIVDHWTAIRNFFVSTWNDIWKWTSDRVTDIRNFVVSTFDFVIDWIKSNWTSFVDFWRDLWNTVWKWCSDRISDVRNFIVSTFHDVVDKIHEIWNGIPGFFSNLLDKVKTFFKNLPSELGYAMGHAAGAVVKGLENAGEAVGHWVTVTLPDNFSRGMTNLGHWFRNQGKTLLDGFVDGITDGAKALWHWVTVTLPDNFDRGMTNLGHWFRNQGKTLLDGFVSGITNGASAVWHWVTVTLPDNFSRGMTNLGHWFRNEGKTLLDGFLGGINDGADGVWHWVTVTLPDNFNRGLTNLLNWMRNQGKSIVDGFLDGLKSAWNAVWKAISDFCSGFIKGFKDALGIHSPSTIMMQIGKDLIQGLINGIQALLGSVWNVISGIGSKIGSFFSGAGSWLWNAGSAIINGLLSGLKSAWSTVQNFVSGIGSWISAHKGPIEVDRVLLTPHGKAIMGGLLDGLQTGGKGVQSYLDNFTTGIGRVGGDVSVGGSFGPSTLSAGSGQNGGTVVNLTVQGSVIAERDLQGLVQKLTLQYGTRNGSSGLNLVRVG